MGFTANTIRVLIVLMFPFVKLVEWISRIFTKKEPDTTVSREEVLAIANVGEEEGVIEKDENKIIQNIIKLDNVKAADVMTPRVVAAIAPESMTLKEYYDDDRYDHFSRIPVYAESPEYITGYVLRDDALENLAEDKFSLTLGHIKRDLPYFSEEKSISDIWDALLKQKSHDCCSRLLSGRRIHRQDRRRRHSGLRRNRLCRPAPRRLRKRRKALPAWS